MDEHTGAGTRRTSPHRALRMLALPIVLALAIPAAWAQSCPVSALTGAPACNAVADPGSNPLPALGLATENVGAHHVGNPIEAIGGNKYEVAVDFRSIASPLAFVRHYNSALSDADTGLGRGWRHGYEARMARVDASRIVVVQGDGRTVAFDRAEPTDEGGERYVGVLTDDGYVDVAPDATAWHLPDGRVLRFRAGWLVAVEGAGDAGDDLALRYEDGRLRAVRSESGLELSFEWQPGTRGLATYGADPSSPLDETPSGHLAAVTLPDGTRIDYAYSGAHTLTGVRRLAPPDAEDAAQDRSSASYRYDDPVDRSLLTGATRWREGAVRTTVWEYDDEGLATAQRDGAGRKVLDIRRTPDAGTHDAGTVEVRQRDGRSATIRWRVDPDAGTTRFDSRLLLDTTRRVRATDGVVTSHAVAASARPRILEPAVARRLKPVPGTLDAELRTDGGAALRLRGTADGRVLEVRVAGRRVAPLGIAEARVCAVTTAQGADMRVDRLASDGPPCIGDVLWAIELAAEVEERAAKPAYQTRAGRNGPRRDPFCKMPGSKDCDALLEDYEMAELSSCVYRTGYPCPAGWDPVDPRSFGMQPADLSFGSFHAEVFHHPATGRNVVVFRGTDNGGDWWDNIVQGIGGTATTQFEQALMIADRLKAHHSQAGTLDTLGFAGHSLGGGLATAAALRAGREATVFNPSRLTNRAMEEQSLPKSAASGSIDVVRVQGEAISLGQTFTPAPGTHTMIARPPGVTDSQKIVSHGIDSVIISIENYLAKHCSP